MYRPLSHFTVQALLLTTALFAVPAPAQTATDTAVFYVSQDEYEITVPTTCPTRLRGGFTGFIFGFEHRGYSWHADWIRTRFVSTGLDVADYGPATGESNLTSRDERAIWYNAGIRVRCTARHYYLMGRLLSSEERYRVIGHFGTVVPVDDGGCAGGDYMMGIGDSTAVPLPGDSSVVPMCGDSGGGTPVPGDGDRGTYGGGSTGDSTFPQKCGEMGGTLYYDVVSLVQWNEKTGSYDTVWTGVAAICET